MNLKKRTAIFFIVQRDCTKDINPEGRKSCVTDKSSSFHDEWDYIIKTLLVIPTLGSSVLALSHEWSTK